MKKVSMALAAFVVLSANTCKEDSTTATVADLVGKQWTLESLGGEAVKMAEGGQLPWIKADAVSGKIEGFGGCNQLMGSYKLDGSNLSFPGLGSTKMMCPATQETENKFKAALSETSAFKIDGNTLKLLNGATEVAALVTK
ncbi:MAG: META domain-containing protein [Flavobacteriales bacterium]